MQETEQAIFEALKQRADEVEGRVQKAQNDLTSAIRDRGAVIAEFRVAQREAMAKEMERREVVLCTKCWALTPEQTAVFVFIERADKVSCGHERSCYSIEESKKLHRLCPECAQEVRDRHGWRGEFDQGLRAQPFFNAFSVECTDSGGMLMSQFGHKVTLSESQIETLPQVSESEVNLLAARLGLPPELKRDGSGRVLIQLEPEPA